MARKLQLILYNKLNMKNKSKIKIKKKNITGKVISISEENNNSNIKLVLDNYDININSGVKIFELGDNVKFDAEIEVNNLEKRPRNK